jgi:hypothetical protein
VPSSSNRRSDSPERCGQEHVVELDGAATPLALYRRRREQRLSSGVGDEESPFGIREQNRVRDGVDDRIQQRTFPAELILTLSQSVSSK